MPIKAANIRPITDELPVDAQFVKDTFLFGVNLNDDNGNELPDAAINFYIASAVTWLERELGIYINPVEITDERHDYYVRDYESYAFLKAFHYPIREVTKVAMRFPLSSNEVVFDPSWYRAESISGQINLIPEAGSLSTLMIGNGGSFLPLSYAGRGYMPHVMSIDYKAGFEEGEIPEDILNLIGMKASLGPLNIAGDLIAGAGIASKSISLDGLSESVSTTSSATNAGYGARIIQYEKQIKEAISLLRRSYKGIEFVVA